MKTAIIAGSSGLIGGNVLEALLHDDRYSKVVAIGRRKIEISNSKLEQRIVDFDHLGEVDLSGNDIFCCLGTTIKKAGSQANFRQVDFNYPLNLAERSSACGAEHFMLVSSIGADPKSKVFYSRIKGETEEVVSGCQFKAVHIFRPSILLGPRPEFRLGESIGKAVMLGFGFLLTGRFKKYRAIKGSTVASAMIKYANQSEEGIFVYDSAEIQRAVQ